MKYIIAALAVTFLVGCANLQKKIVQLNPGDSKSKVIEVMGTPEDTQMKGDNEAWQYCGIDSFGVFDIRVIWFKAGKLTGTTSHKVKGAASCTGYLKTVEWESAPDAIYEVRSR